MKYTLKTRTKLIKDSDKSGYIFVFNKLLLMSNDW